jgi:hypothetical protein
MNSTNRVRPENNCRTLLAIVALASLVLGVEQSIAACVVPPRAWYNAGVPISSHIQSGGEPHGGNFLFEDGRVTWHKSPDIKLGATDPNWFFAYKIPVP